MSLKLDGQSYILGHFVTGTECLADKISCDISYPVIKLSIDNATTTTNTII